MGNKQQREREDKNNSYPVWTEGAVFIPYRKENRFYLSKC